MTKLVIARHGNTFGPNETPRRVGAGTDIPLVESGREQAARIGSYLKNHDLLPDKIYCSTLSRTRETAQAALAAAGVGAGMEALDIFDEIDYGPDENLTEDEVIERIGKKAIDEWNESAKVPPGWNADPEKITRNWIEFAARIAALPGDSNILAVTSNGIARFAPRILPDEAFENFLTMHKMKIATGALCVFSCCADYGWRLEEWNIKP